MWASSGKRELWSISELILLRSKSATSAAQIFFFSSRRRHTRFKCDWSSDVCSSDLYGVHVIEDDVYGPLPAKPLAPISSLIPELSFYCTSMTKSVLAGLRIGYLATPRRLALREIGRASCRERV